MSSATSEAVRQNSEAHAAPLILIALLAASIEPVLVRLGYRGNATPAQLWLARSVVAALVVVPITRSLKPVSRAQMRAVLSVGPLLLLTTLASLNALRVMPVALLVTAMSTTPALVAIGNQLLGRERGSLKFWLGFFCCLAGVTLSVDLGNIVAPREFSWGLVLLLVAMASSAVYRIRLEGLTKIVEPQVASTWFFVINGILAVLLIPFCVYLDEADSASTWLRGFPERVFYIAAWAGVASVLANIIFVKAVRLLGATRMSIFDLLQRPLVVILAAVILGESVTPPQLAGLALVLLGVHLAKVRRIAK
jgi:drug/metabolite transporter (DMT)-like permease